MLQLPPWQNPEVVKAVQFLPLFSLSTCMLQRRSRTEKQFQISKSNFPCIGHRQAKRHHSKTFQAIPRSCQVYWYFQASIFLHCVVLGFLLQIQGSLFYHHFHRDVRSSTLFYLLIYRLLSYDLPESSPRIIAPVHMSPIPSRNPLLRFVWPWRCRISML